MKFRLTVSAAILVFLSPLLDASPLREATVSRIVNDVQVCEQGRAPRRAAERATVAADASLRVGAGSRAEIVFADRTLARLGAATSLSFRGAGRELSLEQGTLLVQAARFRGTTRIRTGSLTVECGGATILVEHLPGKSLKAVALEGELRVFAPGFLGDSLVLGPGKMLITSPDVKHIPDPVDTDLRTLVRTAALIDPVAFGGGTHAAGTPLPSMPRIEREIARQEAEVNRKRLIRTNLVILGSGTNVVIPVASDAGPAAGVDGSGGESAAEARSAETEGRRVAKARVPLPTAEIPFPEAPLPEP